jgi:hypothetical protein
MLEQLSKSFQVHFCTGSTIHNHPQTQKESMSALEELQRLEQTCGVHVHTNVSPNDTQAILSLLEKVGVEPTMIMFDRFYNEEAYSFHFHQHCPNAVLVLDLQDLHCLRHGRQQCIVSSSMGTINNNVDDDPFQCLDAVMTFQPSVQQDARFLRELASCHRCDLILVCSPVEYHLLVHQFHISPTKLCLASFWVNDDDDDDDGSTDEENTTDSALFDKTCDFVFVGGFRHDPNRDAVQVLQDYIWPRLRQELPTANLFIYGAYRDTNNNNNKSGKMRHRRSLSPSDGWHLMDYTPSLDNVFDKKRVSLAPLRFGAGIKGKIVDSWKYGIPVVTTPVGTEGMTGQYYCHEKREIDPDTTFAVDTYKSDWGGMEASTLEGFCQAAVALYTSPTLWNACRKHGKTLLSRLYPLQQWHAVEMALQEAVNNIVSRRKDDVLRAMTWHQALRSTEYFSKWIESCTRLRNAEHSNTLPKNDNVRRV